MANAPAMTATIVAPSNSLNDKGARKPDGLVRNVPSGDMSSTGGVRLVGWVMSRTWHGAFVGSRATLADWRRTPLGTGHASSAAAPASR